MHDYRPVSGLVEEWITRWQPTILGYIEKEALSSTALKIKLADLEGND